MQVLTRNKFTLSLSGISLQYRSFPSVAKYRVEHRIGLTRGIFFVTNTFTHAAFMLIYAQAMMSAIKLLSGAWCLLAITGLLVCVGFIAAMISLL